MQTKGVYTQVKNSEARTLISKLEKEKSALEELDTSWIEFIQSLNDAQVLATEQALYDLNAVDTRDQTKESLLDSIAVIDDSLAALETELHLIETNLNVLNAVNTGTVSATVGQVLVINSPPSEVKQRLFHGEFKNYKPFIAAFMAEFGNQPNIPNIIKLQKLKERCDGAAFDAISRFNSDAGYAEALSKLKERFGRDQDAIEILRQEMYSKVRNKNDLVAVRKAYDEFEGCISALTEFGEIISAVEFKMALSRKVPDVVIEKLSDYERNHVAGTIPTVAQLRKEVDGILMSLEKIYGKNFALNSGLYCAKEAPRNVAVTVKQQKKMKNSNTSKKMELEKGLRENHHDPYLSGINSPKEAKSFAIENHLCFKCYRQSHTTKNCRMKLHCGYCDGKHHELNCSNHVSENTEAVQQNKKELLLMTAEVTVSNPCNPKQNQKILAIIDPGSDVSLVDKNLCKDLCLPMNNEMVEFQTALNQKLDAVGSVKLNIHLADETTVPITSFGVKKLLSNVLVPEASSKTYNEKKPVLVTYDSPKLLLSMKEFQNFVMNGEVTECKNGFSSINSKLGRILCGEGEVQFAQKHTVASIELADTPSEVQKERIKQIVCRFKDKKDDELRRKNGRLKALQIKNSEKAAVQKIEPAPNLIKF
uniref:Uncharacterized protein n=1 Tax=Panagrolaimus sp. ES5 TaxID=591445 RepID=A0AC34F6V1_9BILA